MNRKEREQRIAEWQQMKDYIEEFIQLLRRRYNWGSNTRTTYLMWGTPRNCTVLLTMENDCSSLYKQLHLDIRSGSPDTWMPYFDTKPWHVRQF